jgi:tetratricopeptide (TPR) repeat protein
MIIILTAYTASSLAYYYLADFEKARRDNVQGIKIAERIHADRMLGYLYGIKAFLDNADGDFSEGFRSAQLIAELGERHEYSDLISISSRIIGDIFLLLEKPAKASEYFNQGVELGSQDFWGLDNLIRLGYAQVRSNQTEIGMANLQTGIELSKKGGLGIIEIQGNQFLCYAQTYMQEWEQARQTAYLLERQARKRSMLLIQVLSEVNQAMSEAKLGKSDISLDQLQFTANLLAEIGYPIVELRTLLQLTILKRALGINPETEVLRIHKILERFDKNEKPKQIHAAVNSFKSMIMEQMKA